MDMRSLPISVDQNNAIRGAPYHDARIETIEIKLGSCVVITYVTDANIKFQIHIEKYKKLYLDDISDGFIIFDIYLFDLAKIDNIHEIGQTLTMTDIKNDALKSLLLNKNQYETYKNCKLLYISNSYIGEIMSICEDVSIVSID